MILRVWLINPATKIILITSPSWYTVDTSNDSRVDEPINKDVLRDIRSLARHYGIALADYWEWCQLAVNGKTYHLNELTKDTIHPSEIGYTAMASLVEEYLPDGGTPRPNVLPERLFADSSLYLLNPIRIPGTGYTERTGSGWTEDGTSISSSNPGDTVTYHTKEAWSSFGDFRADYKTNVVEVSLNRAEYVVLPFYQNGYELYSATYHYITIKIPDKGGNVRIDELWLI